MEDVIRTEAFPVKEIQTKKSHCFWGVHNYRTIETVPMQNNRGDEIGRIYIQRCESCGKIRATHVKFYEY